MLAREHFREMVCNGSFDGHCPGEKVVMDRNGDRLFNYRYNCLRSQKFFLLLPNYLMRIYVHFIECHSVYFG